MAWWQWIVLGALLLVGEMIIEPHFYLFFMGVAALALGLLGLSATLGLRPVSFPIWGQWLLFATLAVGSLICFRARGYAHSSFSTAEPGDGVVGESAVAEEAIAPGQVGRVALRGTTWTARNIGDEPLRQRKRARVTEVSGLTLLVRPEV